MSYKDHTVVGVRKMRWDGLWHILYHIGEELTWDRVTKEEALKVAKRLK